MLDALNARLRKRAYTASYAKAASDDARPSARAWHATRAGPDARRAGISDRQRSSANGQRGLKGQPLGGLSGEGNSPANLTRLPRWSGSAMGVAESRACV